MQKCVTQWHRLYLQLHVGKQYVYSLTGLLSYNMQLKLVHVNAT